MTIETLTRDSLLSILSRRTEDFERALENFLREERAVPNLHDALIYSLGLDVEDRRMRGKRIRPVLALLVCEALDAQAERAMPFALAIELMHNFALVHDDIEDGDEIRRHRPAVWKKFGLAHGINIGDYFLCKVHQALLSDTSADVSWDIRLRWIELMNRTLDHTHRGQALDINARDRKRTTREEYMEIVEEKTGYYLAAPLLGGAIVAGADESTLQSLEEYGRHLGPLYQILDDVIDLTSGKGRGESGSDIREGKRSYLVACALTRCEAAEQERLIRILDTPRDETTDADVEWVMQLFQRSGAVEEAREQCRELHRRCLAAARNCPDPLRHLLNLLADYLIERTT